MTAHPPAVPDDPTQPLTTTQLEALARLGVSVADLKGQDHE